jgi:flavodoxin
MSTAILYYSFKNATKRYCERLAAETGADVFEVKERRDRNAATAFALGCMQAAAGKASEIIAPDVDLGGYDKIVVAGPIWAGHPAPAVNAVIDLLPEGKTVTLVVVSAGGKYDPKRAAEAIRARGCTLKEVRSISRKQATEAS